MTTLPFGSKIVHNCPSVATDDYMKVMKMSGKDVIAGKK
jgi:hypothetical protein